MVTQLNEEIQTTANKRHKELLRRVMADIDARVEEINDPILTEVMEDRMVWEGCPNLNEQ